MSSSSSPASGRVTHQYAEQHNAQHVIVDFPRPYSPGDVNSGYWVIYIHGGAWRDPRITADSFQTTQSVLLDAHKEHASRIVAIASIDYRLSAHPDFPQNADDTEPAKLRRAKHPEHLSDILTAVAFLQEKYGFGDRYILVGHSCGATLAFQAVMGLTSRLGNPQITKPLAIVGVEGIYDLRKLRDDHRTISAYQDFIEGAFGSDEDIWDRASPARTRGADGVEGGWDTGILGVIAHSQNDNLVDIGQSLAMVDILKAWTPKGQNRKAVFRDDLVGMHDEMWEMGHELASVVATALEELVNVEKIS